MKIGILSMQRVINSGSFLQAYALKKVVERLGHQVVFVDFRVNNGEHKKFSFRKRYCLHLINNFFHKVFIGLKYTSAVRERVRQKKLFTQIYNSVCLSQLGVQSQYEYNTAVDILIFGSDETFNTIQYVKNGYGYADELYGAHSNAKKLITYAVSCGQTHVNDIVEIEQEEKVRNLLSRFSAFSARDINTKNFIKYFTGKDAAVHVDPVLLYDFDEIQLEPIEFEKYLLVYAYPDRIYKQCEKKAIIDFAKKKSLKIITVNMFQSWVNDNRVVHPFDMLRYFKYADYVVTDTFHGALISIKFQKKFAAFVRDNANKEKLGFLLKEFYLTERQIVSPDSLESILELPVDRNQLQKLIKIYQDMAIKYLSERLC